MSVARETVYLDTCDATTLSVSDEIKGIFSGHAAVWGEVPFTQGPRGGTFIDRGAFKKTLSERKKPFPLLWNHKEDSPIGKTLSIEEDSRGLRFRAKVNLNTTLGSEVFSNIQEGVVDEMSIGFNIIQQKNDNDTLHIREVRLHELSAVTFAANPKATITEAFSAIHGYAGLPIAENIHTWNEVDDERAYLDTERRYQIADVVDDELMVIPSALFTLGAQIASGHIEATDEEIARMKTHTARYYAEMGETPPWVEGNKISASHVMALVNEALRTHKVEPSIVVDTPSQTVQEPRMGFKAKTALELLRRQVESTKARLTNDGQRTG